MAITHQLGPFRLDAQAGVLFRGAEPLGLGQRAVTPLRVLVERAGAPVAKDTSIEAGWAGLAVEEGNLTVQIAAVRRVLRQEPSGENWIETLPRGGYGYIGPVGEAEDESSVAVPMTEATGQTVNCSLALPEPLSRSRTGIFRRWSGRGDHHWARMYD
jgi:DNA-binding winged helix-turn-helix (wHTH) protein